MSTPVENYLESKGLWFRGDRQLVVNRCPFCNTEDWTFTINNDPDDYDKDGKPTLWLYQCFRKSNCRAVGNEITLKRHFGDYVQRETNSLQTVQRGGRIEKKAIAMPVAEATQAAQYLRDSPDMIDYFVENYGWSEEVIFRQGLGIGNNKFFYTDVKDESGEKIKGDFSFITYPYWRAGKLEFVKYRTMPWEPKGFLSTPGDVPLYNADALDANPDYIVIVEGEKDAVSLLCLGEENVVGIPGADSAKESWSADINKARTKYLIFDTDKAGTEGAQKFVDRVGGGGYVVIDLGRFTYATPEGEIKEGKDVTDWVNTGRTLEDFKKLLGEGQRMKSPFALKTMSLKEVRESRGDIEFLIPQFLGKGAATLMLGKPGGGKSTMVKQTVLSVATGTDLMGLPVEQGDVLFLGLDEPITWTVETLSKMGLPEDAPVHFVDELPDRGRALESITMFLDENPQAKLLVVDTLAKIFTFKSINDYSEVDAAMTKLKEATIKRHPHVSLLVIHHANKTGGGLGSTAIDGAVDIAFNMWKDEEENYISHMQTTKARICLPLDDKHMKWNPETHLYDVLPDWAPTKKPELGKGGARVLPTVTPTRAAKKIEAATIARVEEARAELTKEDLEP